MDKETRKRAAKRLKEIRAAGISFDSNEDVFPYTKQTYNDTHSSQYRLSYDEKERIHMLFSIPLFTEEELAFMKDRCHSVVSALDVPLLAEDMSTYQGLLIYTDRFYSKHILEALSMPFEDLPLYLDEKVHRDIRVSLIASARLEIGK